MNTLFKRIAYSTVLMIIVFSFSSCKKMETDLLGQLKNEQGVFQWYDLEWGQTISSTEKQLGFSLESEPHLTTESYIDYENDEYEFADFYPKNSKNQTVELYDSVGNISFGFTSNELTSVSVEFVYSDNTMDKLEATAVNALDRLRNLYGTETKKGGYEMGSDGKSSQSYFWNSDTSSTRLGLAVNRINEDIYSIILEVGTYSSSSK